MQVSQVMKNNFVSVTPFESIQHATQLMQEGDFSILPVCEDNRLVGMIFESDIQSHTNAANGLVNELMTSNMKYVYEDDSTDLATGYMNEFQLHEIPVFNRNQRMTGILRMDDLKLAERNSKIISDTTADESEIASKNRDKKVEYESF
jgi:predicted transcriptional regulator